MIIFYVRCSTAEQNEARQMEDARLHKADRVFIDKASGKTKTAPSSQPCLPLPGRATR